MARRSNEPHQQHYDRDRSRERNRGERLINRVNPSRQVATRSEKLAVTSVALITIAAILIWLWLCELALVKPPPVGAA
jgi:hypothetical protein